MKVVVECPNVGLWAISRTKKAESNEKVQDVAKGGKSPSKTTGVEMKDEDEDSSWGKTNKLQEEIEFKKDDPLWAEYDTLLIYDLNPLEQLEKNSSEKNKGQRWNYGESWNFFGPEKKWVKLIDRIGGKFLFLEKNTNKKQQHIAQFLGKFERFVQCYSLRPLDVLLLVIGMQIECHQQPFFPQRFEVMLEAVQHSDMSCANAQCKQSPTGDGDNEYCCCSCGKVFCTACSEKHNKNIEETEKPPNEAKMHQSEKVHKELLPNMSLCVLLLAGRVRITNNKIVATTAATEGGVTSTSLIAEFRQKMAAHDAEAKALREQIAAREAKVDALQEQIKARDVRVDALQEKIEKLEAQKEKLAELATEERLSKVVSLLLSDDAELVASELLEKLRLRKAEKKKAAGKKEEVVGLP